MFATWRAGVVGCLAVALQGCVYVGNDTLINKQNCIDADGDGVPRVPVDDGESEFQCPGPGRDCDDGDPDRFPTNPEVPYDRIDQDCDNFDLVDVDGDSFPGVAKAEWEAIEREGDLVLAEWPEGVADGNTKVGDKADFDCDDDPTGDDASDAIPDAEDVRPNATELFGDGVDQDCSCLDAKGSCDDYDSDGDGYVPDEFAKDSKLPAGDCDDTDPDVNPGVSADDDDPYDGTDANCDGLNDFDVDGDGYMPDSPSGSLSEAQWHEMFFQFCREYGYADAKAGSDPAEYESCYEALYGTASVPQWGDCADQSDELPSGTTLEAYEVNPGADEVFYDGVDGDCLRDNDFDADGDRYIIEADAAKYAEYVEFWDIFEEGCYETTSDVDTCKDGKDNNKDGRIDSADPACADGATVEWVLGVCAGSDCNDDDSTIHPNDVDDARPGVMERLGDGADQDCEGGNDTTDWQYGGYGWDEPRNVVVGRNSRHWMLNTGATNTDAAPYKNVGIALLFEPTDAVDDDPIDNTTWFVPQSNQTVQTIGGRVDVVSTTDGFYAALSYTNEPTCTPPCTPSPASTYMMAKKIYWDSAQNDYRNKIVYKQVTQVKDTYPDVDLRLDGDGNVWSVGCGAQTLSYVVGDSTANFASKSKGCYGPGNCDAGTLTPSNANTCFVEPPLAGQTIGKGTVCNGTTCTTYDMDGGTAAGAVSLSASQPYTSLAFRETGVDWQNGYRTVIPASGTGVTLTKDGGSPVSILGAYSVKAAAASEHAGKVYVVAVVADQTSDGRDDVVVAYGATSGLPTLTTAVMPVIIDDGTDAFTFDPDEVSVFADGDRVMIGVSAKQVGAACLSPGGALCDVVAWAFVGPQG